MDNNRISCGFGVLAAIMASIMIGTAIACTPPFTVTLAGPDEEWVHVGCHLPVSADVAGGVVGEWKYYVYPIGLCDSCICRQGWPPCGDPPGSSCAGSLFSSVGTYNLCVEVKETNAYCGATKWASDSKTVYAVSTGLSPDSTCVSAGGPRVRVIVNWDSGSSPVEDCYLKIEAGGTAPFVTGWNAPTGGNVLFIGGITSWYLPVPPAPAPLVEFWVEGSGASDDCFLQVQYIDPYGTIHPAGLPAPRVDLTIVDLHITSIVGVIGESSENRFCFNDQSPGVCSFRAQGTTGRGASWDADECHEVKA
jgi:hypothetical protein